jgi:Tol biopolymer transport system component
MSWEHCVMGAAAQRRLGAIGAGLMLAIGLVTALAAEADAGPAKTVRVSLSSHEAPANGWSLRPAISANGRFVAFESEASNLIRRDTNDDFDIFIRDRKRGTTRRVSVSSKGKQANGGYLGSIMPSISADGRVIAFASEARNLVGRRTKAKFKIFVHDRRTHKTTLVSVTSAGGPAGAKHSFAPAISANGRFVAYFSKANNLVRGDTNRAWDIFVHDRRTGKTRRVSVSSSREQGNDRSYSAPAISANGRFIAFGSEATNLVQGDTNGEPDVFVHACETGETSRVNVSSMGEQADYGRDDFSFRPTISADGRFVAFYSDATTLVSPGLPYGDLRVFVHDRDTGETSLASIWASGNPIRADSYEPSISANGRFVAFHTGYVYVHDRRTGRTRRVSVGASGEGANDVAWLGALSADGRFVTFWSDATNLIRRDTNWLPDIFVRGPLRWGSR